MCQPARSGGQNVKCQSNWRPPWNLVILDFYVIEKLVQSLYLNQLNNCLIPDTYFSHIEVLRFAKYRPIKTKEEAYYGCWIRHIWQCSEYYAAYFTKVRLIWLYSKTFMSFLLLADYLPCGFIGRKLRYYPRIGVSKPNGNTGTWKYVDKEIIFQLNLTKMKLLNMQKEQTVAVFSFHGSKVGW